MALFCSGFPQSGAPLVVNVNFHSVFNFSESTGAAQKASLKWYYELWVKQPCSRWSWKSRDTNTAAGREPQGETEPRNSKQEWGPSGEPQGHTWGLISLQTPKPRMKPDKGGSAWGCMRCWGAPDGADGGADEDLGSSCLQTSQGPADVKGLPNVPVQVSVPTRTTDLQES